MRHTLVGYTGFVGGNLAHSHTFQGLYNSKNIQDSFGKDNGLVVYCGMPSQKYLANKNPQADYSQAELAFDTIQKMKPARLVLISTVDVYPRPFAVDEDSPVGTTETSPYGYNRSCLEKWVREQYPEALIIRLPGLYGKGIKKNFIFDMMYIVPSALTAQKYGELSEQSGLIKGSYALSADGFYKLAGLAPANYQQLRSYFANSDFNALSFTDSRSTFQFYNLARLWDDISLSLANELRLVNLAVEPLSAKSLFEYVYNKTFENHLDCLPAHYDMRTVHYELFGGCNGYVSSSTVAKNEIRAFVLSGRS